MSEYSEDLIKEIVDAIESAFRKNDIQKLKEHIEKIETQNKELIEEKDMLKDDYEKLCKAHMKLHELYDKKTLELAESKETFERDNKISYDLSVLKDKKIEELLNVNINLQERIRILEETITELHERQIKLNLFNADIIADRSFEIRKLNEKIKELQNKLDYTINFPDDKVEELVSTLMSQIHDKSDELKKYRKKYKAELTKNNVFIGEVIDILKDMNDIIYRPDHYKIVNVETLHTFKNRLEGSKNRVLGKETNNES